MKSQDILLLLKMASLTRPASDTVNLRTEGWQDWSRRYDTAPDLGDWKVAPVEKASDGVVAAFTVRALAADTGVSKSQVSLSLRHLADIGLLTAEPGSQPTVNRRALYEFLVHGVRYVFPVSRAAMARGIATGTAAPIFAGKLFSGDGSIQVWPDPDGNSTGQAIEPLSPAVPHAVKRDPLLYGMLALTDSLRIGGARERSLAERELAKLLSVKRALS